jgi:hypothetical protein
MALSDAFEKLKEGLRDLSSLEVRTYSGDISIFLDPENEDADFKKLVDDNIKSGTIKLKLYTRLDADGDSDHFFAADEIDRVLLDSHVQAFKMGQDIRRGYLELFKSFAEGIILK